MHFRKEFQKKKQAILQYKKGFDCENVEEISEKSISIDNIEEINQKKDELLSIDSRNSAENAEKLRRPAKNTKESLQIKENLRKGRKKKVFLDYTKEIKEIENLFPKKRGRPKVKPEKTLRISKESDEDFMEEEDFDRDLKRSIKKKNNEKNNETNTNAQEFLEENLEKESIFAGFLIISSRKT